MADLNAILDSIKELKLLEVAELVKMMEEEFGVSAAAPVAVAGAAAGAAAPAEEEKTEFNIVLKDFGANKIAVIKVVRELTGAGLADAKKMVEGLGTIKENVAKAEAEEAIAKFKEAGAVAEMQ